jgi:hypothetical protein
MNLNWILLENLMEIDKRYYAHGLTAAQGSRLPGQAWSS